MQANFFTQLRVRPVIECARGVVQQQNVRVARQRARKQQSLFLPTRKVRALNGDRRVQASLFFNKFQRLCASCRFQKLLVRQVSP